MARVTFSVCDLCGASSKLDLIHSITLIRDYCQADKPNKKEGDICESCYGALVKRLEQEAKHVLPRASMTPTPSKTGPPVLNAIGLLSTPDKLTMGKLDGVKYLDGDEGMKIIPSVMTTERRREKNREILKGGCRHDNGFTMEEDGPYCKDCKEKIRGI